MQNNKYVNSCFNYTGNKYKQLDQLFKYFPSSADNFVDLFCGGGVVGINSLQHINVKKVILNDNSKPLINVFKYFKDHSFASIKKQIDSIITEYHLSNTSKNGYEYYGINSSSGLARVNREPFMKLRNDYNTGNYNPKYAKSIIFYIMIVFAFNNQIRFNKKGEYNLPVGKRDINNNMQKKLANFITAIHDERITVNSRDYASLDIPSDSFVYCDPPYSITTATYSEGNLWTEKDDMILFQLLDKLDQRQIKFALSNVLYHNGNKNEQLFNWSKKYNMHQINFNYNNSNYHSKAKKYNTTEVLITNY